MDTSTTTEPSAQPPTPARVAKRTTRLAFQAALVVGVVVAALATARFVLPLLGPHQFSGTTFSDTAAAPALDGLVFDDGEPADLARFDGEVLVIFFGYTYCPDVCPTTLVTVADAVEGLGAAGDDVEVLMVSVDPDRDTPETVGEYVRHFDPTFVGASGSADAIAEVAAPYGAFYSLHEPDEDGAYLVDHSASLYGIDREGNLVVVWSSTVDADDLQADLKELL